MSVDDDLLKNWEDLKESNDALLENAARNSGVPDPLLVEKNERINKEMDAKLAQNQVLKDSNFTPKWGNPSVSQSSVSQFNSPSQYADSPSQYTDSTGGATTGSAFFEPNAGEVVEAPVIDLWSHIGTTYTLPEGEHQLRILVDTEYYINAAGNWSIERTTAGGMNMTDSPKVTSQVIEMYHIYLQPLSTAKFTTFTDIDIENRVRRKSLSTLNSELNKVGFSGSGVGRPKGLLSHTFITSGSSTSDSIRENITASGTSITAEEVYGLMMSTPQQYLPGASWLMNSTTFSKVKLIKVGESYPFMMEKSADGITPVLLEFPVYLSEYMPVFDVGSRVIFFGNFKAAAACCRLPMRIFNDVFSYKPLIAHYVSQYVGLGFVDLRSVYCLATNAV